MALTTPTDKILCPSNAAIINATTQLQPENFECLKEAKKLLARKKIIKSNIILKLRKKIMQPLQTSHCHKVCKKQLLATAIPIPTRTIITTSYPYQQDYPITMNDWQHLPLLNFRSIPVIVPTSSPIFTTHISPLVGTVVQPVLSPILPQTLVQNVANTTNYTDEYSFIMKQIEGVAEMSNEHEYYIQELPTEPNATSLNTDIGNTNIELQTNQFDSLDSYLKLPKQLFPTPSMLDLDPNPIIDEFCKMPNLFRHMPWLLDLEFGIPKSPITRPIPSYNVKFNSIHCKNTPDAIHPGFESCDPDFKKVLLFYYDCIVSAWYRGYMIMHCDRSVENFQSWLLLPMQVLGMCWP